MPLPKNSQGFATRAVHAGYDPTKFLGSVNPPVFLNATYSFKDTDDYAASLDAGTMYGRQYNPTTQMLQEKLANLERGEACVAFASGMGAIGSVLLAMLSQGDEIIHHRTLYISTSKALGELSRFGVKAVPVDLNNPRNLEAAITARTKMIYFEMPVNPLLDVIDIRAVADYARKAKVPVVVDATFASPALCRPLEFGADLVVHSATKYINGHGDLLAGAAIGKADLIKHIRTSSLDHLTGATMHPLAAASIMRGLQTLTIRMAQHCKSALLIAGELERHPAVKWVAYPFLASHPHHEIARRQMTGGGGIISLSLRTGFDGAQRMMNKLQLISRAVSLGDSHSLALHEGTLRPKPKPGEIVGDRGVSDELIRFAIGLEDTDDILADIKQALAGE